MSAEKTSHELAKELLALPDRPLEFVTKVDGPYCETKQLYSSPWEFMDSTVRLQLESSK